MKKTILVISNPFGYGPTGKAISIISALKNKLINDQVVYAGNSLGQEIMDSRVDILGVDDRNEDALFELFKTVQNPHIVISQNRFAIRAATQLRIPCSFFDGLAWFWHKIPEEHFLADIIFWPRFPNIIGAQNSKIEFVGVIVDKLSSTPVLNQKSNIIITLGGMVNPLVSGLPISYLDLFARGINSLSRDINIGKIFLLCGQEVLHHLKNKISNPGIIIDNLKHADFMNLLRTSKHLVTTGGQTATTESFSLEIPVSFILPVNLSQYALVRLLRKHDACQQALDWQSYIDISSDIADFSEQYVMIEFDLYAKRILSNKRLLDLYIDDFCSLVQHVPNNDGQVEFINGVGTNGADEIASILIRKWNLH